MPLLRITREFLALDVADKPGTAGTIKQRARTRRIVLEWDDDTAELSVVLTAAVDLSAAENGQFGVRMPGVTTPDVDLHGDNDSAVDPATGVVLLNRDVPGGETEAAWLARAEADERALMLQGDWLAGLLNNPKASIAQLAIGQLMAADTDPYNKFTRHV